MLVFLEVFYCCILMAFGLCLALSPLKTFRALAFGKPIPSALENRWLLLVYRVAGVVMLIFVFELLRQALQTAH
ncbi:MAG TPA: hypothetical protein VKG25_27270 [Bryobacteraceae bacterium]|nr:hypothetical protein [Bryobacteraceae bacterium]